MAYVRKVRTGSGAVAVQVVEKEQGRIRVLEHVGSAHTDVELGVLLARGREMLAGDQAMLDIDVPRRVERVQDVADWRPQAPPPAAPQPATVVGGARTIQTSSRLLYDVLAAVFDQLGFDAVGDAVFRDLVIARIVEPTSKADATRVLSDLGVDAVAYRTIQRHLGWIIERDYRARLAAACFEHAASDGDVSLVLYDVTTLYFEAEKEDDLRKVGFSKERRVDPQIVVGLLVDRQGFPLEIGCFEGSKAETHTIVPIIRQFQDRHALEEMVVVADAGMLSAANLTALDEAGLRFIVGSRQTKAPIDLASHFHWHGDAFTDGQTIDTVTPKHANSTVNDQKKRREPVWDPEQMTDAWRAVWHYSTKRAVRDNKTLNLQEQRAQGIIDGTKKVKNARFVKTTSSGRSLDRHALQRARGLVGLKGYVTNIEASLMPAGEVISSYHDLWHVEQSFRMSKTDLKARPMFHRTKDAIEAHLTIVFAALAVARTVQQRTGLSIRKVVHALRLLRSATVELNGATQSFPPQLPPAEREILTQLGVAHGY